MNTKNIERVRERVNRYARRGDAPRGPADRCQALGCLNESVEIDTRRGIPVCIEHVDGPERFLEPHQQRQAAEADARARRS